MQKFKEIWELATAVIRWGALIIGGVCLLVVCMTTGWFPEDMTLGEGVALYFIFVGFLLVYAVYWLGITSVGLLIARWPMEFIDRFEKKAPSHAVNYAFSSFKLMWAGAVWVVGCVATVYASLVVRLNFTSGMLFGIIVLCQGAFGGFLLALRRRLQLDASGLSLPGHVSPERHSKKISERRAGMYVLLAAWIVMPMLPMVLGQHHDALMGSAFRLAQLRKDHATVHVASPWSQPLRNAGLKPSESFLGSSYERFDDVTVRMRSVGSRVVLELPSGRRETRFVNVPRQFIEIE